MKEKIKQELDKIGFKRYYKGFTYLTEVIYLIYENNCMFDFNLKQIYLEVSKKHKVKIGAVKGNINYLINVTILNDYNRRRILNYTNFDESVSMSAKKLVEVILDKLFL